MGVYDKLGVSEYDVSGMLKLIYHRGPDEQRIETLSDIAIGFSRLAIIDIVGGSQPMISDDGTVTIALNGEIYNYVELREKLIHKGTNLQIVFGTHHLFGRQSLAHYYVLYKDSLI